MSASLSKKNLWENSPEFVRRLAGAVLSRVPISYVLGRRFRATCRLLEGAQWWPHERIAEYQLAKVREICQLAASTPFYQRSFAAAGFDLGDLRHLDNLQGLPTTDRSTLVSHLEEMCARRPGAPRVDRVTTGGTGGRPLAFYIGSERSAIEYAYLVTSWGRVGFRLGMPLAVFRGAQVKPNRKGLTYRQDPLLRQHLFSTFHMSDANMARYLEVVRNLGPCYLHVYPSSADALAQLVRRSGWTAPDNIRGVLAESEIVYPEQRRRSAAVFGKRYFSCYGHSEKVVLAAECEHSEKDHVWPTYGYFELLDDQGRRITEPGVRGEIAGTGFINRVVPFVRYRTGDYATYVADRCAACGRNHPVIEGIRGHRTQEFLVAADGSEISWTALNMHDDTFDRVVQFQFRQDIPGAAVLRVVPTTGFGDEDEQRILRRMRQKLDGRVELTLQRVESIALSPRGKAIFVDQSLAVSASDESPSGAARQATS